MITRMFYIFTKFNNSQIRYKKRVFKVDIADTFPKKALGLMYRKSIKENEGMFFIMGKESKYEITMLNMKFPIDIIWIGKDGRIVDMHKDAKPSKGILIGETYAPRNPAKYVLEVASGVANKAHFEIGEKFYLKQGGMK